MIHIAFFESYRYISGLNGSVVCVITLPAIPSGLSNHVSFKSPPYGSTFNVRYPDRFISGFVFIFSIGKSVCASPIFILLYSGRSPTENATIIDG